MMAMDRFASLLPDLPVQMSEPRFLLELAMLVASLLLAWLLSRLVRSHSRRDLGNRTVDIGLSGLRSLSFPLIAMALLILGRFFLRHVYGGEERLLHVAMVLAVAQLLLRMVMFALAHTFAQGFWQLLSMRLVATVVWVTVALHVFGVLSEVIEFLDGIGFTVGKERLSLWILLQGVVSVLATLLLALWVGGLLEERLKVARGLDENLRLVLSRLLKGLMIVLAVLVGLPMVGIDLTTLSVFGGALGVGLGFGLQKIASNYVSGFILLLDRSIQIGSVIAVGNDRGQVTRITTRYTVLRDVNGVEAIVPNETLVSSVVKNESYTDTQVRLLLPVQVAYGSDLERVLALLTDCVRGLPRVLEQPSPRAFVDSFGDSGINLQVGVWIDDPEQGLLGVKSNVNLAIWHALEQAGISIPFPQREVRILGG